MALTQGIVRLGAPVFIVKGTAAPERIKLAGVD